MCNPGVSVVRSREDGFNAEAGQRRTVLSDERVFSRFLGSQQAQCAFPPSKEKREHVVAAHGGDRGGKKPCTV